MHLRAGGGLRGDGLEAGVVELRPGDDDVLVPGRGPHGDGGAQQFVAVGSAARGGEHERFGLDRFAVVADAAVVGEVAGEADAIGQGGRGLARGDGVVDGGVAVDPHLVDEVAQPVGVAEAFPFRGGDAGVVEDLAQPEDHPHGWVLLSQPHEGFPQLGPDAVDVAVDDDQVGFETEQGGLQQPGTKFDQVAGGAGQAARPVAVAALGDARDGDPVEALGQGEA